MEQRRLPARNGTCARYPAHHKRALREVSDAHGRTHQGVIEAVGNGWTTEAGVKVPLDDVAVGDKVMFRWAVGPIKWW